MLFTRRGFLFLPAMLGGGSLGWLAAVRKVAAASDGVSELEWHVLFVTNQQRIWRRLPTLTPSDALASVARGHSQDMLARHFFDHRTPEGLGPRERIGRQRVRFELCSENIYSITDGPSDPAELASVVVGGWMATAGHRRNILDPDFHYAGVGAAAAGRAVMVTQLFGG